MPVAKLFQALCLESVSEIKTAMIDCKAMWQEIVGSAQGNFQQRERYGIKLWPAFYTMQKLSLPCCALKAKSKSPGTVPLGPSTL